MEKTPDTKGGKKKPNWFKRAWNGIKRWFREMKSELKKVVWPTKKQVMKNTVVAVTVMVVSGIVLWAFDQVAMLVVQTLISIGG
jgi:preprotein translocase subunit SecE